MKYEAFVVEMVNWFPNLRTDCALYTDEEEPLPYIALGAVLIPWLESCLENKETANIAKICEFLEVASVEVRNNSDFDNLIGIEIGEWLPEVKERELLLAHLGPETKRVCDYHIIRLPDISS